MFDVGFSELLVIALVALVVLGPERLPKAARFAGLWVRRARAHWHSVKSELEDELADEDMRRSILRTRDELRDAHAALREGGERLRADVIAQPGEPLPLVEAARLQTAAVAARSLPPASNEAIEARGPATPEADEQP